MSTAFAPAVLAGLWLLATLARLRWGPAEPWPDPHVPSTDTGFG